MSCGVGIIHGKASKQKLNAKITTESEVVAVSEYVPYKIHIIGIFWDKTMFYTKKMYQDKKIAIKIERNVRNSCTGSSRKIPIRYFFVKYRKDNEYFSVEYCNTLEMLADFFTKPLQGSLFLCLRVVIMRWVHVDILQDYVPPPKK